MVNDKPQPVSSLAIRIRDPVALGASAWAPESDLKRSPLKAHCTQPPARALGPRLHGCDPVPSFLAYRAGWKDLAELGGLMSPSQRYGILPFFPGLLPPSVSDVPQGYRQLGAELGGEPWGRG